MRLRDVLDASDRLVSFNVEEARHFPEVAGISIDRCCRQTV